MFSLKVRVYLQLKAPEKNLKYTNFKNETHFMLWAFLGHMIETITIFHLFILFYIVVLEAL